MTVNDANAMTMAQYAMLSNSPMVKSVTFSLLDCGSAMTDIPFINKKTLIANGVRWEGNLPSVNWGAINSTPVTTLGTPKPYQESAFVMRNAIKVDKVYVDDENAITDPRGAQLAAYLKAVSYDFNDKFINNDHVAGDSNAPVGLKSRIDNGSTFGVWSKAKIDAGGTDLSLSGMTAATANKFIEQLAQLLWTCDSPNGAGITLYMNEVLQRRIDTALRTMGTSGGLTITTDQYDRTITKYKGAVIKDIGYKSDQATQIIPGNGTSGSGAVGETAAGVSSTGSSAVYTSIYAVNYGEDHFYGWQYEPVAAHDLGLLNDGVTYSTVVDWAGGLMNANIRSVGRLYDLKIA